MLLSHKNSRKLGLLVLAGLPASLLAGCGFAPLYGGAGGNDVQARLEQVKIANIPERTGQLLRQDLQMQMQRQGAPDEQLYVLSVSYDVGENAVGELADSATTRVRFSGVAQWRLTPVGAPQQVLAHGQAESEDALNVIDQQYFAQSLESSKVNAQLAAEIADQITGQVAVYFRTHPGGG